MPRHHGSPLADHDARGHLRLQPGCFRVEPGRRRSDKEGDRPRGPDENGVGARGRSVEPAGHADRHAQPRAVHLERLSMEVSRVDARAGVRRCGGVRDGASGVRCVRRVPSAPVAWCPRHLRRHLGHGGCAVGHQRAGVRHVGLRPAHDARTDAQARPAAPARRPRRPRRRAAGLAAVALPRHELTDDVVAVGPLRRLQRRHIGRLWVPVVDLRPTE